MEGSVVGYGEGLELLLSFESASLQGHTYNVD